MSGGVARAEKGDLVVMVGGPRERFDVCRPLLDRLGTTAYVGENVGDGQALKLVNQLLAASTSRRLPRRLDWRRRSAWTPERLGGRAARRGRARSCSATVALGMLDGELEPVRARSTSSSRTWGWWSERRRPASCRRRWLPPPSSFTWPERRGAGRRDDSSLVTLYERWAEARLGRMSRRPRLHPGEARAPRSPACGRRRPRCARSRRTSWCRPTAGRRSSPARRRSGRLHRGRPGRSPWRPSPVLRDQRLEARPSPGAWSGSPTLFPTAASPFGDGSRSHAGDRRRRLLKLGQGGEGRPC